MQLLEDAAAPEDVALEEQCMLMYAEKHAANKASTNNNKRRFI